MQLLGRAGTGHVRGDPAAGRRFGEGRRPGDLADQLATVCGRTQPAGVDTQSGPRWAGVRPIRSAISATRTAPVTAWHSRVSIPRMMVSPSPPGR